MPGPLRSAAPNLTPPPVAEPAPEEASADEETVADPSGIYDDGDAVIVPAPSAEVFRTKPKPTPKPKKHYTQTIEFKQTIIPVLLTLGVIGLFSAAMPFVVPSGSPLSRMRDEMGVIGLLGGMGFVLLAFAAMNIMQVKSALEAAKRAK